MKRWMSGLWLMVFSLLLTGCATTSVQSNVTAFHEWPAELKDKSYVFERTPEQDNNLEYRNYENLVRNELKRLGFTEAGNAKAAQLKASLEYGVSVRDVRVIEPVAVAPYWPGPFWGPPWPGYYRRGYYGPFYDPFWYGPPMIEQRDVSFQVFTRQLKVKLARVSDNRNLYEVTVVSEGTNGSLPVVMPYMVRSAFADFPGPSGVPRRIELKMEQ
jgi:hypothetical protein